MHSGIDRLPANLRAYTAVQDYDRYTPRDQASWRYIMRQSRRFFQDHAHPIYVEGLEKTGIPIDEIPRIEVMNERLAEFGWGAICVTGFIPPAAFLEFQARSLLPIAADMRTLEHIAYTPAPDIVHEAAGHAPIIADKQYATYLTKYARLAKKAIYSDQDVSLYEAVRMLSDMKENPDATATVIAQAELGLEAAVSAFTFVSESAQITRMYWWTAEYGLIREKGELKIYGAGLLSSLSESQACLSDKVRKIPMSLDCVNTAFNITEPQPQLFVADSFDQLVDVLDEMEQTMAFRRGGIKSLEKAKMATAVTTTVLDSGLAISGILTDYQVENNHPIFMKWHGPVQLSLDDVQLSGHGRERHPSGFSAPLGHFKAMPSTNPSTLSDRHLQTMGIVPGKQASLSFSSGFTVSGTVQSFTRSPEAKLILITWSNCLVTHGDTVHFKPEWGEFDLAIGTTVPSVFGGPADFAAYGEFNFGNVSSQPGRTSPYRADEVALFAAYQQLRDLRRLDTSQEQMEKILAKTCKECMDRFPGEWLLAIEILELYAQRLAQTTANNPMLKAMSATVLAKEKYDQTIQGLIANGLAIIATPDR